MLLVVNDYTSHLQDAKTAELTANNVYPCDAMHYASAGNSYRNVSISPLRAGIVSKEES